MKETGASPAHRLADLRRALVEALTAAAGHIEHAEGGAPHVLRARTRLKRAAALVAPFAPSLKKADVFKAEKTIRRAHRALRAARAATVLAETLGGLGLSPSLYAALIADFAAQAAQPEGTPVDAGRHAHALRVLAMRAAAWPVGPGSGRRARDTIADAYRTARRNGRKAFKSGADADLHDLRRRAIALSVQLAHWSSAQEKRAHAFKRLRGALGAHRDLALALDHVRKIEGLPDDERRGVVRMIRDKRRGARRRAARAFDSLFVASPGAFVRAL